MTLVDYVSQCGTSGRGAGESTVGGSCGWAIDLTKMNIAGAPSQPFARSVKMKIRRLLLP